MPSPKWKLVVDIGDVEETTTVPISAAAVANASSIDSETGHNGYDDVKEASIHPPAVSSADQGLDERSMQQVQVAAMSTAVGVAASNAPAPAEGRDPRIDAVVALLGEFMPSDPQSPLSPYLSGFMSLRLLLLRPSRSADDDELMRTMLDSYSSYTAGGRQRQDIAVMLARDFIFLSQQQQQQQHQNVRHQSSMLSLENPMMHGSQVASSTNTTGLSLFGLPSTSSSLQNSPALAPIPVPGNHDSMSIVSN